MMAESSGSFKKSMWLIIWKKRVYLNFLDWKCAKSEFWKSSIYRTTK